MSIWGILFIWMLIAIGFIFFHRVGYNQGYIQGNKNSDIWYSEALNQPQILTDSLGRYSLKTED